MMDIQISVLTLVKGRKEALVNLINGLSQNDQLNIELVIVHMNEACEVIPPSSYSIRSISCYSEEDLPLSKARNLAMAHAAAEHCVFIDVDCIPAPNFIAQYMAAFAVADQLWSGQVRYLKEGFPFPATVEMMEAWSRPDPIRSSLDQLPYELFWSLNFGCSKSVFAKIGGFDERYTGYGAEDTDFSFMARSCGVEIGLVNAMVYHQPHPGYDPPLNHLQAIVNNAGVFYAKWQCWPMEGWLQKFRELGYVLWSTDKLNLVKVPTALEMGRYLK